MLGAEQEEKLFTASCLVVEQMVPVMIRPDTMGKLCNMGRRAWIRKT